MDQEWLEKLRSPEPAIRRQAIRSLARSGDQQALKYLKYALENDPDPQLREYARRGARYLWDALQQGDRSAGQAGPSIPPPKNKQAADQAQDEDSPGQPAVPRRERDTAERKVQRALSLQMQGKNPQALRELSKALTLNPALKEDQLPRNLAAELTGFPPQDALRQLLEPGRNQELVERLQGKKDQQRKTRGRPVSVLLLIFSVLVLAGASFYFIRSGSLDHWQAWLTRTLAGRHRHSAGGTVYYLLTPRGEAPEDGWPVVVGLHGYGGDGRDMLAVAGEFTSSGMVYAAPSFGKYSPNPGPGPIGAMREILTDVSTRAPINDRGVVLLGFSQGGTFAYRFSVYHSELVAGVVTAGAPSLDPIEPSQFDLPYFFTWGSLDGLQDFVLPSSVYPLIDRGYNVRFQTIPGAGHEVTPFAVEQARLIAESVR